MKALELFCGTKSFSKVAEEHGIETLTSDINYQCKPDIWKDILRIDDTILERLYHYEPDIIWASPPCQGFTVAQIGRNWYKNHIPKTEVAKLGMKLLDQTIYLIKYLRPKYWFIENPRGKMRKIIDKIFEKYGIVNYQRRTVTYCQYGDIRMKPTDIWTNCYDWIPKPMCKNGDSCHERAPRGSRTGTQGLKDNKTRSIVPKQLCEEIIKAIKEDI